MMIEHRIAHARKKMKVSCLTVTQASRLHLLQQAALDFAAQTHPDKELVVVHDSGHEFAATVEAMLIQLGTAEYKVINANAALCLGELRNLAMRSASGTVVCQWDDDDRYHPLRISLQLEKLMASSADACFLTDQLHLLETEGEIYWVDWTRDPWPYDSIPGTLMGLKSRLPSYNGTMRKGEDTAFCLDLLRLGRKIQRISGLGWTYIYRFHGKNCWDASHHFAIIEEKAITSIPFLGKSSMIKKRLCEFQKLLGNRQPVHTPGSNKIQIQSIHSEN